MFLCYGRHDNLGLLQHYGFVLPDNAHDTAELPSRTLPPAVRQQLGAAAGGESGGGGDGEGGAGEWWEPPLEGAHLTAAGTPSWDLLRALRLGCASPAERKASAFLALSDRPISAASERAAWAALRAACVAAAAALPTSAEEDERELAAQREAAADATCGQQQQQAAQCMCVAIEWRLCHKRILQRGLEACDAVLAALGPPGAAAALTPADLHARVAAMQRKPRW